MAYKVGLDLLPVWKAESEKLQTCWPEEQLSIFLAEIIVTWDVVTELEDHIDAGGEEVVELGDPGSLHRHQSLLAVHVLLLQLRVLKQE